MITKTAKQLLTKNYKMIDSDQTLTKAVALFDTDTDVLLVFEGKKYKGVVTERMILESGLNKKESKVDKVTIHAPKIEEETSLVECARLMIENDVMQLPVFDNEKVLGVVTADSILAEVSTELFGKTRVSKLMSDDLIVCSPEDTIYSLAMLFRNHHISRVPVVSNNTLVGIVSMHDVINKAISMDYEMDVLSNIDDKNPLYKVPVEYIMTTTVETVKPSESVKKAIDTMLSANISAVVVVDDDELPVGIVTKRDILENYVLSNRSKLPVEVQISSKIKSVDKLQLRSQVIRFIDKHKKEFEEGLLYVHLSEISAKSTPVIQCSLRLYSDSLRLIVKEQASTAEDAIRNALHLLLEKYREEKQKH